VCIILDQATRFTESKPSDTVVHFFRFSLCFSAKLLSMKLPGTRLHAETQGQTISVTTPVLSVLTLMAEDNQNQQPSPNSQNAQNTRRDAPRYHSSRRHHSEREQAPRPAEKPEEKPQESKELSLDDEETEQDRSSAPSRQSRGGGRGKPPKRVIEEWASDIYCE
jgi:stringent starvation protein B